MVSRERGVEGKTRANQETRSSLAPVVRNQERKGADEFGRQAKKDGPLAQRLAHEPELAGFEITDAAVDQLGGAAARPGSEVAPLEQEHPEPAHRRVARHGCALDAASNDEEIEWQPRPSTVPCPIPLRRGILGDRLDRDQRLRYARALHDRLDRSRG